MTNLPADPFALPPTGPPAGAAVQPTSDTDLPTTDLAAGACLIAITFADPMYAQEALLAALRLKAKGHLDIDDAAIVSRAEGGRVRIQQTRDLNMADGAMSAGWWGLLAGLFVGQPLVGGALGAALGGLWGKLHDVGISDPEMKRFGETLAEGEAALFLLLRGGHRWHAIAEARRFPGRVLHTTLSAEEEAELIRNLGAGVTTL
ncbi:MAG TPA: DUF1269 domain-containing protein [Euzebya sp.]|nr:DUF1269 domain-containing protein [Euzebya sp.]